jgi:ubiquinone/menaquinone biosynthesis C-methylase UbiE
MPNDKAVSDHYQHGHLLQAIEAGLAALGKSRDNVTVEDLGPVDEFHVGGRVATDHFLSQLKFSVEDHVLDVGCGLGGASRFVATEYESQVTGIDLTQEYVDTGNELSAWVGLGDKISLQQGSALEMPFANDSFSGAYMLHVGMNIADKAKLFAEVFRTLRPGSLFGVYDVMRQDDGDLAYPLPWARDERTSSLATPDEYVEILSNAGFEVVSRTSRREFALEFFRRQRALIRENGGPPPLGVHVLMQQNSEERVKNMVANLKRGSVAPAEIVARKA